MKKSRKQNNMVNYDVEEDVLYLGLKSGAEEEFVEISPGVSVEFNNEGEVIGVEILNASKVLKPALKPMQSRFLGGRVGVR